MENVTRETFVQQDQANRDYYDIKFLNSKLSNVNLQTLSNLPMT